METIIDENLLQEIFNQELIIYEDIKAVKLFIKYNGNNFIVKTDLNSDDINNIEDQSMQNYYGKVFNYLDTLDNRIKSLLNRNWYYVFQYFPLELENYTYNRLPKNNLVLTSIIKNNKIDFTIEELEEYSNLLNVECLPIIFKGKLNEKSIESIKNFLNTSIDDLEYVFGEKSFAYFFYKLLNPQIEHSFLMNNDFNDNIENLIIKIDGKDQNFSILNPLYKKISEENITDYEEIYSLILINFLNFCQSVDIKLLKIKGNKRSEVYSYIICKLFNIYITEVGDDIKSWNMEVPLFFNDEKFYLNKELITNKLTKDYLSDNKLEYIFKCIYFSFNKEFKEEFGVFTKTGILLFNDFVKYISNMIDEYFNKKSEIEFMKRGLVNYDDWSSIKGIDVDGDGKVHIQNNIKDVIINNSKKKKGVKDFYKKK